MRLPGPPEGLGRAPRTPRSTAWAPKETRMPWPRAARLRPAPKLRMFPALARPGAARQGGPRAAAARLLHAAAPDLVGEQGARLLDGAAPPAARRAARRARALARAGGRAGGQCCCLRTGIIGRGASGCASFGYHDVVVSSFPPSDAHPTPTSPNPRCPCGAWPKARAGAHASAVASPVSSPTRGAAPRRPTAARQPARPAAVRLRLRQLAALAQP